MNFNIKESSLFDLYNSTVVAFPNTKKRQHSIDTIHVQEISFTPFIGMKTLFVKSNVLNENNGNKYKTIILFKEVIYHKKNIKMN